MGPADVQICLIYIMYKSAVSAMSTVSLWQLGWKFVDVQLKITILHFWGCGEEKNQLVSAGPQLWCGTVVTSEHV